MRTRSTGLAISKKDSVGSNKLLGGDDQWGFYGEVPASELITGDELADMIGLTAGTSQNSNVEWLKFNSGGRIIFSPKKSVRFGLSWNSINAVNAVYGDKVIKIHGLPYKVRLWNGISNEGASIEDTSESEWDKLMLPISVHGVEDWGMNYTDQELNTNMDLGNGSYTWCMDTPSNGSSYKVRRGGENTTSSGTFYSSGTVDNYGWRPVLELVTTDTIIEGNDLHGYYGKYKGIITPNDLISMAGITQGTTKNDDYNDPNDYITWLKFSHNYKTLFVADRTIHYGVSWNHLNERDLVFGKVVDIDGQKYLLRLLQGANVNPASVSGGANSNDEWDSLIVQFTPNTEDSHWYEQDPVNTIPAAINAGGETITQETPDSNINNFIYRGALSLDFFSVSRPKDVAERYRGYRPVLEVL